MLTRRSLGAFCHSPNFQESAIAARSEGLIYQPLRAASPRRDSPVIIRGWHYPLGQPRPRNKAAKGILRAITLLTTGGLFWLVASSLDTAQVTVIENVRSANAPRESVARTTNENVPRVVGVPVIRPGLAVSCKPGGIWPDRNVHV